MHLLDELRSDAKYSFRTLRRQPGLAGGIILTLMLAIGANAAMFGLVERLLLAAPSGVSNPGTVGHALFAFSAEEAQYTQSTTSYPAFEALRRVGRAFSHVAAVRRDSILVNRGESLSEIAAVGVTGDYFAALRHRVPLVRPSGVALVVLLMATANVGTLLAA